jgi:hypothetical protein
MSESNEFATGELSPSAVMIGMMAAFLDFARDLRCRKAWHRRPA